MFDEPLGIVSKLVAKKMGGVATSGAVSVVLATGGRAWDGRGRVVSIRYRS